MKEIQEIVRLVTQGQGPWVLATLVSVDGSSYRRAGARALIQSAGSRVGSVSGGCLEEDVLARAAAVAQNGQAQVARYDTTSENDVIWGTGLGCHGVVQVLIEPLTPGAAWIGGVADALEGGAPCRIAAVWDADGGIPLGTRLAAELPAGTSGGAGIFFQTFHAPTELWIFGAGDDAQPLARMAAGLGWRVLVADPRSAYATTARFPSAQQVFAGSPDVLLQRFRTAPDTGAAGRLAVIMTHHYIYDQPLLAGLIAEPLLYLGLLGPRQRAERLLAEAEKQGVNVSPERLERLHAPVGLDLGADGADEVALSILAEMRAILGRRDGRPLRERSRPIHDGIA